MSSIVAICNRALQAMGTRSTIASLTEASSEARNCSLLYDQTRQSMLSRFKWGFARATQVLAMLKCAPGTPEFSGTASPVWSAAYPSPPWLYEYAMPSDCLSFRYVVPLETQGAFSGVPIFGAASMGYASLRALAVPFVKGTDKDGVGNDQTVVLTDQPQAVGVYTRDITNSALFSAEFADALALALAARLAIPLSGDKELMKLNTQMALATAAGAEASDAAEDLVPQETVPDWIATRDAGWGQPW